MYPSLNTSLLLLWLFYLSLFLNVQKSASKNKEKQSIIFGIKIKFNLLFQTSFNYENEFHDCFKDRDTPILCVCFVDRCFSVFFWPLCCLFFDLWILITPLVSSNTSLIIIITVWLRKMVAIPLRQQIEKEKSNFEFQQWYKEYYDCIINWQFWVYKIIWIHPNF